MLNIIGLDTETILKKSVIQVPIKFPKISLPRKSEILALALEMYMKENANIEDFKFITPEEYELKKDGYFQHARISLMSNPYKEFAFEPKNIFSYQFFSAQFWSEKFNKGKFVSDPQQVTDYFSSKTRGYIFLAQNAEYDFAVLSKTYKSLNLLCSYNFSCNECEESCPSNRRKFICLYNKGRFIYGKLVRKDHVWSIYDLRNIFVNWSLKRIGEFIGLEKLDKPSYLGLRAPETLKEKRYFRKYALRDAEICYKAGQWIINKLGIIKVSAPSLSFNVFNKQFKPYGVYLKTEDSITKTLRLAYKGGRSECFIRGSPDKKVYVYDVVSLYSYIMWKHKFPLGIGKLKHKNSWDKSHEGIAYAHVQQDAEIPFLSKRKFTEDGTYKLVFPNGDFYGWFTYPELRYLEWKGLGKILKVYEAYEVSRSTHIFRPFVDYFFNLKQTDVKGSSFWKLFLNSLYGKFAQDASSPELLITPDEQIERPKRKFMFQTNIMIAAYITARARIYMHTLYDKVGLKNMVYTDTDSIHTFKPFNKTGENLGNLSFKGETDAERRSTYIRSKFYVFNDVLKCKGLQYVLKAEDMRKLIEIGNVEVLTKMLLRIRSAFRRHKELLTETAMMKRFTLENDGKRVYAKLLNGKQLLDDWCDSKAVVLHGLE